MKEAVTKVIDTLTQKEFNGAFQKLWEWVQQVITSRGLEFHVCTMNKSAHTEKVCKPFEQPSYIYIYIYIYCYFHTYFYTRAEWKNI